MKDKEIEAFESRHGYKPTPIRVAIDALAVYVNKDNPLDSLSINQVDAMFSATRRCGGTLEPGYVGQPGIDRRLAGSSDPALRPQLGLLARTATSSRWRCVPEISRTPSTSNPAPRRSCKPWLRR